MITVLLHVPIAVPPLEVISAWIEVCGATGGQSKIDNQGTKIFLDTVYLLGKLQEGNYDEGNEVQ